MGNKTSQNQNQNINSLASEVDDIALNYILTQNTIDLLRLTDKEYYDNLIILTSSVIEKRFNGLELGFLQQRIFGKQNDAMDIVPASNKIKEQVIFNISKFYIKIIMIYGAIATTIDPQYSYEVNGVKRTFYLKEMSEYKNIPRNVTPELVNLTNPMNLCRKRLTILKNKLDPQYDEKTVKLNPGEQLCSLSSTTSLTDEVGIKELDLLYFDIFDYETKTWSKRSAKMKQKYNKDLTLFYQIFTGKVELPESITSFNDIELLDLSTIDNCSRDSFKKDLLVSNENRLVKMYQEKIKLIEQSTQIYRSKLVNLLKELFLMEEKDGVRKRVINPKLTLDHILIIENDTRDTILNLYTSCEKYFIQALILFEKIYDEQVKSLNENRVDFIDNYEKPGSFQGFVQPDFKNSDENVESITPNFGKDEPFVPISDTLPPYSPGYNSTQDSMPKEGETNAFTPTDSSIQSLPSNALPSNALPSNTTSTLPSNALPSNTTSTLPSNTLPSNTTSTLPSNTLPSNTTSTLPSNTLPSNTTSTLPSNAALPTPEPMPSSVPETPATPSSSEIPATITETPTPSSSETPATPPLSTEPPATPPTSSETPATPLTSTETPATITETPATPPTSTETPPTPPTSTETPATPPLSTETPATPPTSTEPPATSTETPEPEKKGFFSSIFSSTPEKKTESDNPPSTAPVTSTPSSSPVTPVSSPSPVATPAPTPVTPVSSPSPVATPTPTPTSSPVSSPSPVATPSPITVSSPSPVATPTPTPTPSPSPVATPAPSPLPPSATFANSRPNAPKINKIL
jgi:hypothetical protein